MIKIGVVEELVRYPVKSMAGTSVPTATLGWHGLAGDRRFAFRRVKDRSDFPWLSASRFPGLLLYSPFGLDESAEEPLPSHVRTPSGEELELRGEALREEISARAGYEVEVMNVRNGVFDDAVVSVITSETIDHICREAGVATDARRFRSQHRGSRCRSR